MAKIKILFFILASILLASCTSADKNEYDTRAVAVLDLMSETIGELESASYTLNAEAIKADGTEINKQSDVYFRGHDKMYIHSTGTKGKKGIWYNGSTIAYYSFNTNTYATIDAPDHTINAIDFVHDKYGYDIPAADFFYPSLTDDILGAFDQVLFLGDVMLDGRESTSIIANNKKTTLQIWVDKTSNLPLKFVLDPKSSVTEFYQASFSNFRANPALPDLLFEFKPPINSEKTEFKSTQSK